MPGFLTAPHWPEHSAVLGQPAGILRTVIPANTAVTFPLVTIEGAFDGVHKWRLENLLEPGVPVAQADPGGTALAIGAGSPTWTTPADLPAGAWRWVAEWHTADDAFWGTYQGDSVFVTYASDVGLHDPDPASGASGPAGRDDAALMFRCGLPVVRLAVRFGETKNIGTEEVPNIVSTEPDFHSANQDTLDFFAAMGWTGKVILTFPNMKKANIAPDVQRVLAMPMYAAVTHAVPTNEPLDNGDAEGGILGPSFLGTQKAFYQAVKATRPGVLVGTAPTVYAGPGWIPQLTQALAGTTTGADAVPEGLAPYFDVWNWHEYPGHNGNIAAFRTSSRGLGYYGPVEALMSSWDSAHGTNLAARPRMMDEAGTACASLYGAGLPGQQAYTVMADLRLNAQHKLSQTGAYPYFYGRSHGFGGVPSWASESEPGTRANVYPMLALTLARAVQLHEPGAGAAVMRPWLAALDFGRDDAVWIGNLYGGADGTRVLDLQSIGRRSGTLTLALSGPVPATLAVADAAGNPSTVSVSAGHADVTVSSFGGYVHLPAGCTVAIVPPADDFVDPALLGLTEDGPTGGTSRRSVLEGEYRDALLWNLPSGNGPSAPTSVGPYRRADPIPLAGGEQLTTLHALDGLVLPRMIRLYCLPPWQTQTTVLRAEIRDDAGRVIGTLDETPNLHVSGLSQTLGWYVAPTFGSVHAFDVDLTPVEPTTTVTVAVLQTSRGGSPTDATIDGFGGTPLVQNPDGHPATASSDGENVFGAGFSSRQRTMWGRLQLVADPVAESAPGLIVGAAA
jgi:hypothetical protein